MFCFRLENLRKYVNNLRHQGGYDTNKYHKIDFDLLASKLSQHILLSKTH